jgi:uncharacterized RDD family membrane protein YckC
MKCHGCGHEFAKTFTRCPRCHRATSRRGRPSTDSRLLEFPKRVRVAQPDQPSPVLPAWRIELNEKVRAIRAKRNTPAAQLETSGDQAASSFDAVACESKPPARYDEQSTSYGSGDISRGSSFFAESIHQQSAPVAAVRRSSTNIVEAALTRVKRASENASRAALPKIEPARPIQTPMSLAIDRQATARALAPAPEIETRPEPEPIPALDIVRAPIVKPAHVENNVTETGQAMTIAPTPKEVLPESHVEATERISSASVIDDLEPLDYLEAEIRKVDKALGAEFLKNESPSIFTHVVINLVDLIALALSCLPFLAIVSISDGTFSQVRTRFATAGILILVSFFYLALTQSLCGKTFGMMLTNTRVVDELSFETLSASRALLRTAGYFIAAMPAMVGIVWAAFNRRHRGWQDFFSGTVVVRDF